MIKIELQPRIDCDDYDHVIISITNECIERIPLYEEVLKKHNVWGRCAFFWIGKIFMSLDEFKELEKKGFLSDLLLADSIELDDSILSYYSERIEELKEIYK